MRLTVEKFQPRDHVSRRSGSKWNTGFWWVTVVATSPPLTGRRRRTPSAASSGRRIPISTDSAARSTVRPTLRWRDVVASRAVMAGHPLQALPRLGGFRDLVDE